MMREDDRKIGDRKMGNTKHGTKGRRMKAEGATDRTRMKHGFNSVFHPCSIGGWVSLRTLPALYSMPPTPGLAEHPQLMRNGVKHSKRQNTNRLPAKVYGDGLDAQHRPKNCEGIAHCASLPSADQPCAATARTCSALREPPRSKLAAVAGGGQSHFATSPRVVPAKIGTLPGAQTTRKREFLGRSWVRPGFVLGSSWVHPGFVLGWLGA